MQLLNCKYQVLQQITRLHYLLLKQVFFQYEDYNYGKTFSTSIVNSEKSNTTLTSFKEIHLIKHLLLVPK